MCKHLIIELNSENRRSPDKIMQKSLNDVAFNLITNGQHTLSVKPSCFAVCLYIKMVPHSFAAGEHGRDLRSVPC